jgi:hypothetical protein
MDSGKSAAGKQSKPSHFDAAARGATANRRFITPEPGMSQKLLDLDQRLADISRRLDEDARERKAKAS